MRKQQEALISKTIFGSHLYGTATELSDRDYKSIYLPSLSSCILNQVQHGKQSTTKRDTNQKNTNLDVDNISHSLQHFILNLGRTGDTTFLDMLHTPTSLTLESSDAWQFIRQHRSLFYTKTLKAYLGFARAQAARYGQKGERLQACVDILNVLRDLPPHERLGNYLDRLPHSQYTKQYLYEDASSTDKRVYDFCGKKLMATTSITHVIQTLEAFYNERGHRALSAQEQGGVDWKALSHAFRVTYQLKELYTIGDIIFPLKNADFLIKIKKAEFHNKLETLSEELESLITEVSLLAEQSLYPEQVAMQFWEDWIISLYNITN